MDETVVPEVFKQAEKACREAFEFALKEKMYRWAGFMCFCTNAMKDELPQDIVELHKYYKAAVKRMCEWPGDTYPNTTKTFTLK